MTFVDSALLQGRRNGHIKLHGPEGFRGHAQGRRADGAGARSAGRRVQARRHHRTRSTSSSSNSRRDHNAYPAPLNYRGYRKSICTSINHVVCHGIPDDKPLRDGDIVNIDVTLILDGWHGDASRMYVAGEAAAPRAAADRRHLRVPAARHRRGQARRDDRRHRLRHPDLRRGRALLGGARLLRPRPRAAVPRRAEHPACRPARRRRAAASRHVLHHRADDQSRRPAA